MEDDCDEEGVPRLVDVDPDADAVVDWVRVGGGVTETDGVAVAVGDLVADASSDAEAECETDTLVDWLDVTSDDVEAVCVRSSVKLRVAVTSFEGELVAVRSDDSDEVLVLRPTRPSTRTTVMHRSITNPAAMLPPLARIAR